MPLMRMHSVVTLRPPTEKLHSYNVFSDIRILCDSKRVRYLVLRPGAPFSQPTPRPPAFYIF